MTPYATADDVAARWRPLSEAEEELAETLALDASFRVRRRFPTLEARLASGAVDEHEVRAVVAGMVKRAMLAGDAAVVSQQEMAGPFQRSVQYANPMGSLFFTDDDLAVLADSSAGSGVSSVRLTSALTD